MIKIIILIGGHSLVPKPEAFVGGMIMQVEFKGMT